MALHSFVQAKRIIITIKKLVFWMNSFYKCVAKSHAFYYCFDLDKILDKIDSE